MGSDIPRKGGPAIQKSDLLIINKADLAPYVGVDLQAMEKDVKNARRELPYVFGEMKNFKGIENISDFLFQKVAFNLFWKTCKFHSFNKIIC